MGALDIFNEWSDNQKVYLSDGSQDGEGTKLNYLNATNGEGGNIEILKLAGITGIARTQFYRNKDLALALKELKSDLNKKWPGTFAGDVAKKNTKSVVHKNNESDDLNQNYDQSASTVVSLARHNTDLEKQLNEEKARGAELEMENNKLQDKCSTLSKKLKMYEPSIKALISIGALPEPAANQDGG